MRLFILLGGLGTVAIIGLSSIQTKPDSPTSNKVKEDSKTMIDPRIDSVSTWEVEQIVNDQLVARLEGQGGLTSSWQHMDKSGHRTKVFTNVGFDFKNLNNYYISLSDKNEVFGDVVRVDGSLRSHVCSFKIVYPSKTVYARKSVLDKWQSVVAFTGVKKAQPMRESMFDLKDEEKTIETKEFDQ